MVFPQSLLYRRLYFNYDDFKNIITSDDYLTNISINSQ